MYFVSEEINSKSGFIIQIRAETMTQQIRRQSYNFISKQQDANWNSLSSNYQPFCKHYFYSEKAADGFEKRKK